MIVVVGRQVTENQFTPPNITVLVTGLIDVALDTAPYAGTHQTRTKFLKRLNAEHSAHLTLNTTETEDLPGPQRKEP